MKTIQTELLEIAFEDGGPENGLPVMLLHGWPDAPRCWNNILPHLHKAGFRTIAPYLRGFGPTRFLKDKTLRVGTPVALAQDVIDLADTLGLSRFAIIGHDWGARIAYTLAAIYPDRLTTVAALSVGYQPRGQAKTPSFEQSRRYWYQWFQCTEGGAAKVKEDPIAFARIQWDTWSPASWFSEEEFTATAESFKNPDWPAITLNSYRSRWRDGELTDPRYDTLQQKLQSTERIGTPTLMIHGGADACVAASETEGLDQYFTGGYSRLVIQGVGHFVQREAPNRIAAPLLQHLHSSM